MLTNVEAVIFDMDGVLIDSEPLWRQAMIKAFGAEGMILSDEDCRATMGLRFNEVIRHWMTVYHKTDLDPGQLEENVMILLLDLIEQEGSALKGIPELIAYCKSKGLKLGLATSSSNRLMTAVLKKLNLAPLLDACLSAEHLPYGKPHPEVFLQCAQLLNAAPAHCVVIEDSLNGVIAGKAARMTVIAVPEDKFQKTEKFIIADYLCENMEKVLTLVQDGSKFKI